MTKDERTAFYGIVQQFVPNLTEGVDHHRLDDDRTLAMIGEAMAQLDAQAQALLAEVDRAQQQADADPAGPPEVSPEQMAPLLRAHGILYNDVHPEVYRHQPSNQDRTRFKVVPRPAMPDDVIGSRDTGAVVCVVLRDGTRHRLAWLTEPAAEA